MSSMTSATDPAPERWDVVIVGAGLAGLTLARHLLLDTDKTVLLLDRRAEVPGPRQKVGEATVQVSGYYLSRVLDLEEHLLTGHYMKYNLRFFWKTAGRANRDHEDYSQSYIRKLSNIATYQLDRNQLEAELLRLNRADPRFAFRGGAEGLEVDLSDRPLERPHRVRFTAGGRPVEVTAPWVVDATGRNRLLSRRLDLKRKNPIRHGASFAWVEGLVDVERLTTLGRRERLLRRDRTHTGHLPSFLATNHFMGEGFWFWVIPLHGKTSLGVVYDTAAVPRERVATPEKLIEWVCEEFPLFARDLPHRRLVDHGGFRDFSYDCGRTIGEGWAMTGEAGRFSDPLYSPGGDLIAIHNTLIVAAVGTADPEALAAKVRGYERLMRAVYEAYVPSYAVSYQALGDQEAFTLKYTWELTVYFAFYVVPFINHLFTDRRFVTAWLTRFARLGPMNAGVQRLLAGFYQWKAARGEAGGGAEPHFVEFLDAGPLAAAEKTFYRVGLDASEARSVLAGQLANLEELARWTAAHVAAAVVGDERLLTDRAFVEGIDPAALDFDAAAIERRWAEVGGTAGAWEWSFDPLVLRRALGPEGEAPAAMEEKHAAMEEKHGAMEQEPAAMDDEPAVAPEPYAEPVLARPAESRR
jgi:flavin-dependent dehydrogenase